MRNGLAIRWNTCVALRKESVDRNIGPLIFSVQPRKSLSARRAWIEISTRSQPSRPRRVALRKESVDRNRGRWHFIHRGPQSLSARRAWIEIGIIMGGPGMTTLSLSARRAWIEIEITITDIDFRMSLSARRAWIEILASGRRGTGAEWSLSARRAWIEIPTLC